jgi:hypothetical protein
MEEGKFLYEQAEEFNAAVADWAKRLQAATRAAAAAAVSSNRRLSRSIVARLRRQQGEVYNVGLKIAKEGVYVHVGASRGHGGNVGGSWIDRHGRKRHTSPQSLGKANSGNRPAHEFLNSAIDELLPELSDIAAKYFEGGHLRPNNVSVRIQM